MLKQNDETTARYVTEFPQLYGSYEDLVSEYAELLELHTSALESLQLLKWVGATLDVGNTLRPLYDVLDSHRGEMDFHRPEADPASSAVGSEPEAGGGRPARRKPSSRRQRPARSSARPKRA